MLIYWCRRSVALENEWHQIRRRCGGRKNAIFKLNCIIKISHEIYTHTHISVWQCVDVFAFYSHFPFVFLSCMYTILRCTFSYRFFFFLRSDNKKQKTNEHLHKEPKQRIIMKMHFKMLMQTCGKLSRRRTKCVSHSCAHIHSDNVCIRMEGKEMHWNYWNNKQFCAANCFLSNRLHYNRAHINIQR